MRPSARKNWRSPTSTALISNAVKSRSNTWGAESLGSIRQSRCPPPRRQLRSNRRAAAGSQDRLSEEMRSISAISTWIRSVSWRGRSRIRIRSIPASSVRNPQRPIMTTLDITDMGSDVIVVTGGAGFIGSAMIRHLIGESAKIVNLDALTYAANPASLAEQSKRSEISLRAGRYRPPRTMNACSALSSNGDRPFCGRNPCRSLDRRPTGFR